MLAIVVEGGGDGGGAATFSACGGWVRFIEGLEGDGYFLAEVEFLPAAENEKVLCVLFDPLALVGHELIYTQYNHTNPYPAHLLTSHPHQTSTQS